MLKKLLATAVVLTFVVSANATITASGTETWGLHQPEPLQGTNGGWGNLPVSGLPYYNFRLMVHVTDGPDPGDPDDFTAAGLDLILSGPVHFYEDLSGGGGDPAMPALFPVFPDLEYDSYVTTPGDWPNGPWTGSTSIAADNRTPTVYDIDWFDIVDTGNGDYYIANITVTPDDPQDPDFMGGGNWRGDGHLQYAAANTGGQLFDYYFTIAPIPEPGSLALLALGALALIRRR